MAMTVSNWAYAQLKNMRRLTIDESTSIPLNTNSHMTSYFRKWTIPVLLLGLGVTIYTRPLQIMINNNVFIRPKCNTPTHCSEEEGFMSPKSHNSSISVSDKVDVHHQTRQAPTNISSISLQQEKDERPLLIFHIGPHKTGTSAIQCSLVHHQKLLRSASFQYSGRIYGECLDVNNRPFQKELMNTRALVTCLNNHAKKPCNEEPIWKYFKDFLHYHSIKGHNIILSDEALSRTEFTEENIKLLQSALTKRYHTRVVIGYRRYHEWFVSFYNEYAKVTGNQWGKNEWITKVKISFPEFYRIHQGSFNTYSMMALREDIHPADWLKRLFGGYFDDVTLFNLHQEDANSDLASNFIHQVAPELANSLSAEDMKRIQNWNPPHANKSVRLDYSSLAIAAQLEGLVDKKWEMKRVTEAIEAHCRKYTIKLPIACISDIEQAAFLNRSISYEHILFHDWEASKQSIEDQHHRSAFEGAVEKEKLCTIDQAKALEDKEWHDFFASYTSNS
eukprot:scaffold40228_cov46-Attheya_sp.AAC.3